MKTENKARSHNLSSSLRQFIVPTTADVLLYIIIGGLLLVALNAKAIWEYFSSDILKDVSIGEILGIDQNSNTFIADISQGRTLQVLFWALVGIIAYILLWILRNVLVNLRNDIVADEYLHPPTYSRMSYWETVIGRKVFFAVIAVVLVGYSYACFNLLLALAESCRYAVEDFLLPASLVDILLAWLCVIVLLHILIVLVRFTIAAWRQIYLDL